MKKQPIFVAVDTNNIKRATQIVNAANKYIYGVKFGLEFFCSKGGRETVDRVSGRFQRVNEGVEISVQVLFKWGMVNASLYILFDNGICSSTFCFFYESSFEL